MKQTAVEWLVQEINKLNVSNEARIFINKLENQAKQMEKEQIIKSNRDGVDMVVNKQKFVTGEEYYNETFNTEDK